jgi:uncharacterized protein (TIGR02996 family)
MSQLDALLAGIVQEPREETRWLVLADWLQEYDDPRRAELLRLHRRMLATCCEPDAHPERAAWQARMVELLVAGVRPCVPQETLMLPGGVPMTFSFIPPGAFLMGSNHPDGRAQEKPVHRVEVPHGFFMGVCPVTQAQWKGVIGTKPSRFKGPKRPVEQVSCDDCQEFCAKLSDLVGRRVELPMEVEWEFACRAGTTTEYHFGDTISTNLANYLGNISWNGSPKGEIREQTTNVGSFPANPWGLYDVHGNVREWCASAYYHYPRKGNDGMENSTGTSRVLRGGFWHAGPDFCRSARRYSHVRMNRNAYDGFRVCLRLS